jgi:hypothetical protein
MIAKLPITAKLDGKTLALLESQAQAQGLTRSGAITMAIEAWLGIEPASPTGTPASPGTLARLETLSGQLEALSARVGAIEARLTAPVAAPAPTAPTLAPAPAPTAPTPAPAPAPTEGQGQGLDINSACQLAGLTDRDWKRNLGTVIKRRYQTSPDRALTARGWRKVKRLWYPPA